MVPISQARSNRGSGVKDQRVVGLKAHLNELKSETKIEEVDITFLKAI